MDLTYASDSPRHCRRGEYELLHLSAINPRQSCTEAEITAGAGDGTGCNFDMYLVWTSDSCSDDHWKDQCRDAGSWDPSTGQCSPPTIKADGVTCNDGIALSTNDQCTNGLCVGCGGAPRRRVAQLGSLVAAMA